MLHQMWKQLKGRFEGRLFQGEELYLRYKKDNSGRFFNFVVGVIACNKVNIYAKKEDWKECINQAIWNRDCGIILETIVL